MADSCECLVFEKDSLTAARDPSLSAWVGGRGAMRCLKGSRKRWIEPVSQSFWGLALDSLASALIKLCQYFGRKKKKIHIFKSKPTNNFTLANHFIKLKMSSCLQSSQMPESVGWAATYFLSQSCCLGFTWMANWRSPHFLVKAKRLYLMHNLSRPLDFTCLDWQSCFLFPSPLTLSFSNCPLGSKEHPTRPLKCWIAPWQGKCLSALRERKNWEKYMQLWYMTGCWFLVSNFLTFSLIITIINLVH